MQATGVYSRAQPLSAHSLPSLGIFSLWFGMALVGMTALYNAFGDTPASECLWGILHVMRAMFAALLLGSFLHWRRHRHEAAGSALLPVAINCFTLAVVFLVPFNNLWQTAGFDLRQEGYLTVANWVEESTVYPDSAGWIVLPGAYQHLTTDGRIQVDRQNGVTQILFVTREGLLGQRAILYRSDSSAPSLMLFGQIWSSIEREAAHWYLVEQ